MPKTIDNPKDYNVQIKKSLIHGYGVFTSINRKKDDLILPYVYKEENVMKWGDFKQKYRNDFRYTYSLRRIGKIICVKNNRNIVSFINDNTPNENTYLKAKKLYAKRDINAGEELTLSYPHYDLKKRLC